MLFSSFGELSPSPRLHQRIYNPQNSLLNRLVYNATPLLPAFPQKGEVAMKAILGVGVTSSVHRGLAL